MVDAPSVGRRRPSGRLGLSAAVLGVAVVLTVAVCEPVLAELGAPASAPTAVVDVTETLVAAAAAIACAWRARVTLRARRRSAEGKNEVEASAARIASWWILAAACASWMGGQGIWTVYEVLLGLDAPVLSVADVGFLGFAAAAPVAMALMGRDTARPLSRARSIIDGVIAAGALFVISWVTALGSVVNTSSQSSLALLVNVGYPVGDLVVLAVAVMVVARTRLSAPVVLLAAGSAAMALSDSAYVYLSSSATFVTGGLADAGWTAAFVLVAAAAVSTPVRGRPSSETYTGLALWTLPYWPLAVAGVLTAVQVWHRHFDRVAILTLTLVTGVVLVRQGLVVIDNILLARQLRAMAYTDALTGIANRAAFTETLERHVERGAPVTTVFCDLDGFKAVNDHCGHAIGDAVLAAVAQRLTAVARSGDIVARLGGDEFGVILTGNKVSAELLEHRLSTALSVPFPIPALLAASLSPAMHEVVDQVTVSVGVVSSTHGLTADDILAKADARMYEMKHARRRTLFSSSTRASRLPPSTA